MRALDTGSRVLLAAALVLVACAFAPTAHCHGVIAFPPVQLADRSRRQDIASEYVASDSHRASKLRGARVRDSLGNDHNRRRQHLDPAALLTASSDLMREIDSAIPDCGESRIDVEPVDVTSATQFVWQNDVPRADAVVLNEGPCEIWIDRTRAFASDNCGSVFASDAASIALDYSICRGECLLTLYWLVGGASERAPEPLKQCVLIRNGVATSSSTSNHVDMSSTSSGSGALSPAPSSVPDTSLIGDRVSSGVLDALYTLAACYDAVLSAAATPSRASLDRTRSRWHRLFMHRSPYQPLLAPRRRNRHHEAVHYSASHTKSKTQQCVYTASGFMCTSTEHVTNSFRQTVQRTRKHK